MKKQIITLLIIFSMSVSSCGKFLDESSQDLVRPISAEHYKELLQGEAYFTEFHKTGWFIDAMTDNFEVLDGTGARINDYAKQFELPFKWASNLEPSTVEHTLVDNFFKHMYKNILVANSCLNVLDEMQGTEEEKNIVKGQASFTRAYAYFCLANTYAQAYNMAQPTDLCVPLIEDATPSTKKYKRNTIAQVWSVIKNDIETAIVCMKNDKKTRSQFEINYDAVLILATRIHLYMGNYDQVIAYSSEFLRRNPTLLNISQITTTPSASYKNNPSSFLNYAYNPEIKWTFGKAKIGNFYYTMYFMPSMNYFKSINIMSGASENLRKMYSSNDRRLNYWFTRRGSMSSYSNPMSVPVKYVIIDNTSSRSQNMRSSEVYLNMAEAYIVSQTPQYDLALKLINDLRRNRIGNYTDLTRGDVGDDAALLKLILDERRRELCFEEYHRWWDLRRCGQPQIEHNWLNKETYVLEHNDPAYVLNFPRAELEYNDILIQNVRPQRAPKSIN